MRVIADDLAALLDGPPDQVVRALIVRAERAERAEAPDLVLATLVSLGERLARYGLALDVLLRLGQRVGPHEGVDRGIASAYLCLRDTAAADRCLERHAREPMENEAWALADAAAIVGANGEAETASRWLVRAGALVRRTDDHHPAVLGMARAALRLAEGLLDRADRDGPSALGPAAALLPQCATLSRAWAERTSERCEIATAEAVLSGVSAVASDDIGALAHALAAHAMCTVNGLPPTVGARAAVALVRAHERWAAADASGAARVAADEARAWGLRQAALIDSPRAREAAIRRLT